MNPRAGVLLLGVYQDLVAGADCSSKEILQIRGASGGGKRDAPVKIENAGKETWSADPPEPAVMELEPEPEIVLAMRIGSVVVCRVGILEHALVA